MLFSLAAFFLVAVCEDYVEERTGSFTGVLTLLLLGIPFAVGAYMGSRKFLNRDDSNND